MHFSFKVLGSVEVSRAGEPVIPMGKRLLALLAGLLLAPNRIISAERLTEWVWGDSPPSHPRSALQNAVSRVRQVVGQEVIETTAPGYRLLTDAGHLDLLMFEQLIAAAADSARQGAAQLAVEQLSRAIGLWRPPLLANVEAPVLRRYATGLLTERYLAAHEERARLCLRLGLHTAVVTELLDLVHTYPFREPLAGQLMLALFRGGRRADALLTYQTLRQVLRDELGIEPSSGLQDLHTKILRLDPGLYETTPAPTAESAFTTEVAPAGSVPATLPTSAGFGPPRQLPGTVGRLHGRAAELDDLDGWWAARDPRTRAPGIVALVGPAGIGKTALAVQWANRVPDRFPDGQLFLDLAGFAGAAPLGPGDALAVLLGSLGVPGRALPPDERARAALFRSLLRDRRVLVVLDNARNTDQVRPLLPGPEHGCVAVVTSRNQLRGLVARDGARRVRLAELTPDSAKALLCAVTGWAPGRFPDTEVAELVGYCAGLPLALRIVAERLARDGGTLAEVLARLRRPELMLDELSAGDDGETDLRTVLSGSCRALEPEVARGYHRLGRHPTDELSLDAAARLLNQSKASARRVLDGLIAVHLAGQRRPDHYHLPALLRAHAAEEHDHDAPDASERTDSAMGAGPAIFGRRQRD